MQSQIEPQQFQECDDFSFDISDLKDKCGTKIITVTVSTDKGDLSHHWTQ
jgi:hypothetical protein